MDWQCSGRGREAFGVSSRRKEYQSFSSSCWKCWPLSPASGEVVKAIKMVPLQLSYHFFVLRYSTPSPTCIRITFVFSFKCRFLGIEPRKLNFRISSR